VWRVTELILQKCVFSEYGGGVSATIDKVALTFFSASSVCKPAHAFAELIFLASAQRSHNVRELMLLAFL
jgi:hypothetical protein